MVATAVAVPVTVVLVLLANRATLRAPAPLAPLTSAAAAATALPPVRVDPPPLSAAADRACPPLVAGLPLRLRDLTARPVQSSSPYVLAWGQPPVVLRCGVPRPAGFRVGVQTFVVDSVAWFVQPRPDRAVWTAVDRAAYVEVTVPPADSSGPIVAIADAIRAALPEQPIRPGR